MIKNEADLRQAREALSQVEAGLRALRLKVEATNPRLFSAMAQDYVDTIKAIRCDIDSYIGVSAVAEGRAALWMLLEGAQIRGADISSRVLTDWLDRLRKSIYGVVAFLEHGVVRSAGRPDATLVEAADLSVTALTPGSIRVGFRLPSYTMQSDLFRSEADVKPLAAHALERILLMSAWAGSGSALPPLDDFQDPDEATVVARSVARIVPTARGPVESVQFSGEHTPSETPLSLRADAGPRLEGLIQLLSKTTQETVIGVIREIDLDARRITLRERGPELSDLKCDLPEALVSTAERLLDKPVSIVGFVSSSNPTRVSVQSISPIRTSDFQH